MLKLDILTILLVLLAVLATSDVEANEGFYLMIGAGDSESDLDFYDDDACRFGAGYALDYKQLTFDFAYRDRFDCDADIDDDDADIETYSIDVYWYPFK